LIDTLVCVKFVLKYEFLFFFFSFSLGFVVINPRGYPILCQLSEQRELEEEEVVV